MKAYVVTVAPLLTVLAAAVTIMAAQNSRPSLLTLDQARQVLMSNPSAEMLGAISLRGFNWSREVEIGGGLRMIAISRNLGGELLLFSSAGALEASVRTDEITWLQLFDLNDDGISEIMTEEIEGKGTGILLKNFVLYGVSSSKAVTKLWEHPSYRLAAQNGARPIHETETQFFLRFDIAGAGKPSRMTYLEPTNARGQFRKTVYVMNGSNLHQISESDLSK